MDVVQKAGAKYCAHEEFIEFEIKGSSVLVGGNKITHGLKDGKLQVTFAKGKADNPIVQGIVVYNAGV